MNKTTWVGFLTLLRKETIRIVRIWPQTLLPSVITATLYFIIFGAFLGQHIGLIHGVSYASFLVPGFVMMNAINAAYANVSSSFFSAKFMNSIDEILISPLSPQLIMWGYVAGGIVRGVLIGLIILLVSLFFVPLEITHVVLAFIVLLTSVTVFSLAGFINGIYAKKFDDIAIIPTFILTPLTYLGGVFYSIQSLPGFWQDLAKLNPVFYLIDAFRYAILGQSDVSIWVGCVFTLSFFVLFYLMALYLLKTSEGLRS